MLIIESNTY